MRNKVMKLTYQTVYKCNIDLIEFVQEKYWEDEEEAWNNFYKSYEDPDQYEITKDGACRYYSEIKCTADGLSVKKIKKYEGFLKKDEDKDFKETYKKYREIPIFFFPSERNSININRANMFDDRIDYTLFDLKQHFLGNKCKLIKKEIVDTQKETKAWLEELKYKGKKRFEDLGDLAGFAELVRWFGIKDIFTGTEEYKVIDLKTGEYLDDEFSKEIRQDSKGWYESEKFDRDWDSTYYKNLKDKIDEWIQKHTTKNNKGYEHIDINNYDYNGD